MEVTTMKNEEQFPALSNYLSSPKVEVSFPLKGEAEYTHVKAKVDVHGNRECEAKQVKVPTDMVFVILGAVIILAVLLVAVIHINITIHASNISEPTREAAITQSDMDPVDQGNSIDVTYDAGNVYAKGDVYVRDNPD